MSHRGRGGKAYGRRSLSEIQETSKRPIAENSQLKLCDYAPKCKKENSCPRAHNSEELRLWQASLLETVRDYSEDFILKLCKNISEVCEKGLRCKHAHSQKELNAWNECLGCRSSSGKLLEMCKSKGKDCSYGDTCRYAHNYKELQSWIEEHEENYLKSSKSKPEMCTYTVTPPTCKLGVNCPYAHSKKEMDQLIQGLTDYDHVHPRPVPRKGKLLPYTMCKNSSIARKNVDGKCIYGSQCPQAHSEEELKYWEEERKRSLEEEFGGTEHDNTITSSHPVMFGHLKKSTEEIPPPEGSNKILDPFLVSLEDFQRHFGHQLSRALNFFITAAQCDIPSELGGYITHDRTKLDISTTEGQESTSMFDLQYQLGFMQRNAKVLSAYVDTEESYFTDVTLNLLEVRNSLAHDLHSREAYEEKCAIIAKYFRAAITFVTKIKDKLQTENLNTCLLELREVEANMAEFLHYKDKIRGNAEEMATMSQQQRTQKAEDTLLQLIQLVKEEGQHSGDDDVTVFVATCLNARFKNLPSLQQQTDTSKTPLP